VGTAGGTSNPGNVNANANPGSPGNANPGNPGTAANINSSNSVVVSPQSPYPIVVAPGGFVTISWDPQ
jgi:hypothetical protein